MNYRPEITGLRALAVLPVVMFHAGFSLFSGGFVGVDVFFVISGYLITTILLEEIENGRFSILKFYERRARRILPALCLMMLVCMPFAWMWMSVSQMRDFSQSLVAVSLFASNVLFWQKSGYFDDAAEEMPLLHTWSLAVEEQYYVLFPVFLMLVWRFGRIRVLWTIVGTAVISLVLSDWFSREQTTANFYLFPTRAWELLAGSIAAFMVRSEGIKKNNFLALVGLAAILIAIFFFDERTPFPSLYALVPVGGTVLLVLYAEGTLAAKFLSMRVFVGIGLISYSVYLWHQPLFAFARLFLGDPSSLLMLTLGLLSIIFGYISWKYVEQPWREDARFNRNFVFTASALSLTVFLCIGIMGHLSNGFIDRYPDQVKTILANDINIFEQSVRGCWNKIEDNPSVDSACFIGSSGDEASFALIGDSHAGALQYVLGQQAEYVGLSGLGLTYQACPPLANAINLDGGDICRQLRKSIFSSDGLRHLPRNIIVLARWALLTEQKRYKNDSGAMEYGDVMVWNVGDKDDRSYSDKMSAEIRHSLDLIVASGRRLIIVYPVPEMGWIVPRTLADNFLAHGYLADNAASVSYDSYLKRNQAAFAALDTVGDNYVNGAVIRIYPHKIFCKEKQRCLAHIDGEALYYDDDHLSQFGAQFIVNKILGAMR